MLQTVAQLVGHLAGVDMMQLELVGGRRVVRRREVGWLEVCRGRVAQSTSTAERRRARQGGDRTHARRVRPHALLEHTGRCR